MARTLLARCVAEQVPPGAIPAGPASVGRRHDERGRMTGIASPPEPGWATGPGDEWQTGQQPAVGQAHAPEAPRPAASTGGWEWLTPQPPRPAQPAPPAWPAQPGPPPPHRLPRPHRRAGPHCLAWPHRLARPHCLAWPHRLARLHRLARSHCLARSHRLPRPLSWPSRPAAAVRPGTGTARTAAGRAYPATCGAAAPPRAHAAPRTHVPPRSAPPRARACPDRGPDPGRPGADGRRGPGTGSRRVRPPGRRRAGTAPPGTAPPRTAPPRTAPPGTVPRGTATRCGPCSATWACRLSASWPRWPST